MKDPLFFSLPVFPPTIPPKPSLSTNRDDHLIPLLSQDNLIFKAQHTSLCMHPTDYTYRLYDKNQDFFTSIASKIMSLYQYCFDNGVKICFLQFSILRPSICDLKMDESDPLLLTVIKHLVPSPLDDKDKSYYTALSKQSYSYNELISFLPKSFLT